MNQIPDQYLKLEEDQLKQRISAVKSRLGEKLIVLGHHYQRDEVLQFADFRGDSLELAKKAAESKQAQFIVFCGVHFMAEAADMLSTANQTVQLPDITAGCPLADFAAIETVTDAWAEITSVCGNDSITPITYINSSAELKAFCGKNHGITCTSSNAQKVLKWAFNRTDKVFFFPDQHLGTNTSNTLGISPQQRIVWDPAAALGGNTADAIANAKVIVWKGHCHVHTLFNRGHISQFRQKYPDGKVVVHPECTEEVVNLSDANGSTSYIIRYTENAAAGETIAIGTEINLVNRLNQTQPDKKLLPLARSLCPNMFKINLHNLCWTLENLGKINVVSVPETIKTDALIALERMLKI
ncbi:MAG TPA: quinolinate synthase NadA [bacterium]|nr:quinolinate synthase NadA [bacterium]